MSRVDELKRIAHKLTGALWKPQIEVEHLSYGLQLDAKLRGYYWHDRMESPSRQFRGPFKSEDAAWIDAIETYGVDPDAPALTPEDPVRVALVGIMELCGPFIDLQCEPVGTLERIAHLAHKALEELP